jgi:23S rRNA (guanosine2251-2'-O)-methyltransferase
MPRPGKIPRTDKIFGLHPVLEALESGKELEKVLIDKYQGNERIRLLKGKLKQRNIPFQMVPKETLNRLAGAKHQGVLAYGSVIEYGRLEALLPEIFERGMDPFLLILDGITDVRNLGAIARSAECAGIHALILPHKGSAQVTADAVKTSAGALSSIPVCRSFNLMETIQFLIDSGVSVVAASEKGRTVYHQVDFTRPTVLILGSEESGISKTTLAMAHEHASIPVMGQVGSLNVSVAAGIMMFEGVRQRSRQHS